MVTFLICFSGEMPNFKGSFVQEANHKKLLLFDVFRHQFQIFTEENIEKTMQTQPELMQMK